MVTDKNQPKQRKNTKRHCPKFEKQTKRSQEHRIVQPGIHPGQLGRQPAQLIGQDRIPQRRLIS